MYLSAILKIISFVTVIIILLAVSACGGDDAFNAGGCNAKDTPTDIHDFAVVGVSTDSASGLEVIDDSGDFTLSWELTSSCTYTYSVSLSYDDILQPIDNEFFSGTCDLRSSCDSMKGFSCRFDATAKTISCDGGPAIDVSSVLIGPSPQTPYIIFTASNEMGDQPTPFAEQVQFEY